MSPYLLAQAPVPAEGLSGASLTEHLLHSFGQFDLATWVIVLLTFSFSIAGWAVIFSKVIQFMKVKRQDRAFQRHFEQQGGKFTRIYEAAQSYPDSPCANIFAAGYTELRALAPVQRDGSVVVKKEMLGSIQRTYEQIVARQILDLERHMITLATTVSICPFLGLLGTVWGILGSFWSMGETGTSRISVVAPGIAQALLATAFGLTAAIPALFAYNVFQNRINEIILEMDEFCGKNISILERNIVQERPPASRPAEAWVAER